MKKKLLVTLAVVLVLGGFAVGQGRAEETNNLTADPSGYTEMSWPDTDMAHSVPTPVSSTGSMYATEKTVVAVGSDNGILCDGDNHIRRFL